MPTIHYTSRAFLSQLGVSDPPRTADEIKSKLRRNPEYFQFPKNNIANNNVGLLGIVDKDVVPGGQSHATTLQNNEVSPPNISRMKNKKSPRSIADFSDEPSTYGMSLDDTSKGAYDVPIAERMKLRSEKRNGAAVSTAEKRYVSNTDGTYDATLNTSKSNRTLRKRKASVLNESDTKDGGVKKSTSTSFCNTTNTSSKPCHNRILNIAEGNEGEVLHRSQRKRNRPAKFADAYDDNEQKEVSSKRGPGRPMKNGREEKDYRNVGVSESQEVKETTRKPQTKRHIPEKACNVKRSEAVGVSYTRGKWEVRSIMYHGKRRYIGLFPSQEKAALAALIVRGILEPTLNSPLTAEEIDLNVSQAKEAALNSGIANSAEDNQVEVFHRNKRTRKVPAKFALYNEEKAEKEKNKEFGYRNVGMNKSQEANIRIPGVRQRKSGNWEVEFRYQGKNRYMGTYTSQDQATVANEVSRGMLKATNDSTLTDEEIESNVSQAKTAALKAVNQQTLLEHESSNYAGPSLVLGRWQTDEAFDEWLSNRKSKWKRQRQHEVVPDSLTGDIIGPSLVPGQWQTEKVFDEWLKDRKSKWKNQHQTNTSTLSINNLTSDEAKNCIAQWMSNHSENPYPSSEEKGVMMSRFGVDRKRLNHWLYTARAKQKTAHEINKEHNKIEAMDLNVDDNDTVAGLLMLGVNMPANQWKYAIDVADGSSNLETLWKQRMDTDEGNNVDEPQYHFFNGKSDDAAISLSGIHSIFGKSGEELDGGVKKAQAGNDAVVMQIQKPASAIVHQFSQQRPKPWLQKRKQEEEEGLARVRIRAREIKREKWGRMLEG